MSGLRLAELPALFWVLLAGRESRAQLRFVLAARRRTERERKAARRRDPVRAAVEAEAARLSLGGALADSSLLAQVRARDPQAWRTIRGNGELLRALSAAPPHEHEPASPGGIRFECGCTPGSFEVLVTEYRRKQREQRPGFIERGSAYDRRRQPFLLAGCSDGHEVLWVEGRGRVCLDCGRRDKATVTVSVNGTVLEIPYPEENGS